jgi:hypothetical protein
MRFCYDNFSQDDIATHDFIREFLKIVSGIRKL